MIELYEVFQRFCYAYTFHEKTGGDFLQPSKDLPNFLFFWYQRDLTLSCFSLSTVPSASPSDVRLHMGNETTLNVYWNNVTMIHQNGIILGYRLRLQREDGNSVARNITVGPDAYAYVFSDLLIFQNYSIQLTAFTVKGNGPWSEKKYQVTDESGE